MEAPSTIEEWGAYISKLSGAKLWSEGIAANSLSFVQMLQDEGASGKDITDILLMFAIRFGKDNQEVPNGMPGEYLSYLDLLASVGR